MAKIKKRVSAILCADLHLREGTPVCRTDRYHDAQLSKLLFLSEQQKKYDCPVICAGDIFDKSKSSPFIENLAISKLPKKFYFVPGNHDLPNHNLDLIDKSSIGVLSNFREKFCLFPVALDKMASFQDIGIIHTMVHQDKPIHPDVPSTKAVSLLKEYEHYKLIVSGDNHQAFEVEYKGRLLINPGSMMRMTADQHKYRPRIYLWYASDNSYDIVYYPIEKEVISRKHLENIEEKEKRFEAFVERLNENYEIGLSYEKNLDNFFKVNKTSKAVQEIIREAIS